MFFGEIYFFIFSLLGISTSKQVLCMPISGQNHLLEHFHFFSHLFLYQKVEKKEKMHQKRGNKHFKGISQRWGVNPRFRWTTRCWSTRGETGSTLKQVDAFLGYFFLFACSLPCFTEKDVKTLESSKTMILAGEQHPMHLFC